MKLARLALPLALALIASTAVAQVPMDPLDARDARRLDRMEQVMRELRAIVFQGRDTGKPVVVQPAPPEPVIVQPAPQTGTDNWYYCDSARAYYPYAPSCPEGWRQVPAQPPGKLRNDDSGQPGWHYCDSAGGYYPYVQSCPEGWKAVPASPPEASPTPPGARQP